VTKPTDNAAPPLVRVGRTSVQLRQLTSSLDIKPIEYVRVHRIPDALVSLGDGIENRSGTGTRAGSCKKRSAA
jgi:hypothetical protein